MPYSKSAVTPDWMRVTEAAGKLDCAPNTLLAWVRDGRLPVRAVRFGITTRIHRGDFEAELKKRTKVGLSA